MKKSLLALVALTAMLASCNKETAPVQKAAAEKAELTVCISAPQTKATGTVNTTTTDYQTADESKVNSIQIFVFNNGLRDGYNSVTPTSQSELSATVSCTAGKRNVYAVVNAPSLSSIQSETALLAATSNLLEDADNFEMIGSKASVTIPAASAINIAVDRIAAKIVLKKITNKLSTGVDMKLKRVYITNVAGQFNYGLDTYSPATGKWYNKGGYTSATGTNLGTFTQDVSLSVNIANNASADATNYYYYAYPNENAFAAYDETWAPKRTLLVIQIEAGGNLYDYPIDLGVDLDNNKMYVINEVELVKLGNPDDGEEGGEDEENPVTDETAQFSVTVNDWSLVLLGSSGKITI